MLSIGQHAPLSIRSSPGQHALPRSYLTTDPDSYSPLHGPDSGITMLSTKLKPRWNLHLRGDEDWLRRHR